MPTWPTSLGSAIFFWTAISFIVFYFVMMIVLFIIWLKDGRPLMDQPLPQKSKPANDNSVPPKVAP